MVTEVTAQTTVPPAGESGTDILSRNVGVGLQICAAQHSRRAEASVTPRRKAGVLQNIVCGNIMLLLMNNNVLTL